jgi:MOSC domain-containing protein YiiM
VSQHSLARIVAVFVSPHRGQPVVSVQSARVIADHGIEGDAHAKPGTDRQMLLMDQETLEDFGLKPGDLKESITTVGLELYKLPSGQRLRVGSTVLALTHLCPPCKHVDEIRPGLQQELAGRRGVLARVVQTGDLRVGDTVEIE